MGMKWTGNLAHGQMRNEYKI